jgi:hypothetical protein
MFLMGLRKLKTLLIGFGMVVTSHAAAQDVDAANRALARQLGNAGVEAFQAGDYVAASEKLEKAYAILRAPSLGLWSARALKAIGKHIEASERYLEVTRLDAASGDVSVQRKAQLDASLELDALRPKIPTLSIRLQGATVNEVTVSLDGSVIPAELVGESRPVNPGAHEIVAVRDGDKVRIRISIAEAEKEDRVVEFPAEKAPRPANGSSSAGSPPAGAESPKTSTVRTVGWIAIGSGAAGIAVGSIAGIVAMSKKSSIDDSENSGCQGNSCPTSQQNLVDSYNSARTISTVGFVSGVLLAGTGVVLLAITPPGRAADGGAAAFWLSPRGAVLRGSF